nr:MAG TPA: DNA-directed RNA polymerase subunit alpha [Caudoviricetes sp.]
MPINIDKVKPFRLLKTPFFTPFNVKDKRHGSAIFLMTKSLEQSKQLIEHKLISNLNMFNSYFLEWNAMYLLKPNRIINDDLEVDDVYNSKAYGNNPIMTESHFEDSENLFFFSEATPEGVLDVRLRRILYRERLRNFKEVKLRVNQIKNECKYIKYTYPTIDKYKNKNIYVDNHIYNKIFTMSETYNRDKAIDLLYALFDRFINNANYKSYTRKTVLIPVNEWASDIPTTSLFEFSKSINPFSMIVRLFKKPKENLNKLAGIDFIFIGNNSWFKMKMEDLDMKNLNLFKTNILKIRNNDIVEDNVPEDKEDIKTRLIGKIEDLTGIEVNNISRVHKVDPISPVVAAVKDQPQLVIAKSATGDTQVVDPTKIEKPTEEKINQSVEAIVDYTKNAEEAEQEMDNSVDLKELILQAKNDQDDTFKISATRKARMDDLNDKFLKEKIANSTIAELVATEDTPLQSTDLSSKVETIDDEWANLKKPNFEADYNIDADIMKCLHSLSQNKDIPMSVIDVTVEDRSTSEDSILTYTVHLEDSLGKRHTLRFDMPKIINKRFLRLRGNDKIIPGQLINLPIIKTDEDTVQVVSNYNKIFITRYGQVGKINQSTNALIRALTKLKENNYKLEVKDGDAVATPSKIDLGNNAKISAKYELPAEYVELSKIFNKVTTSDGRVYYFNRDELIHKLEEKKVKVESDQGFMVVGITKDNQAITVPETGVSSALINHLGIHEYAYTFMKPGARMTYSQASILNSKIPLIVVMAYTAGLTGALNAAGVEYNLSEKRPTNTKNYFRFNDGFLSFNDSYAPDAALLVNGLSVINTQEYSLTDIDTKAMWLDVLDDFGGRNRADGLDSFANLMMDPITVEVCKTYKLPTDYIEVLAYASSLLTTNKFNRHTDITGNRFRTNERLVHFLYKSLATSYGMYLREIKNNRKDAKMTMKQSAVIDMALADVTTSDLSKLSPLLELESANTVTFKGLSGMNSDRSYSLDKRTYDKTMINKLSMSTGFSATVGINRQSTINMGIESTKGYIKSGGELDRMSDANTLSITEALTPFGTTRDDPFRTAMTFIQTSKHGMRTTEQDPLLVSNGADQALPYLTSDTFAHKAKWNAVVEEITNDYMIIANKSNPKEKEFIDLREKVEKNSDGGFFITIKLDTFKNYKKGDSIKAGDIVAYDKSSYSDTVGIGNLAYNIGTLTKIAIMHTDKGFEDSAIISQDLSKKMASEIVLQVDVLMDAKDIDIQCVEVGKELHEGEVIMSYRAALEDQDATDIINKMVQKNAGSDSKELMDEIGKIKVKSKVTGKLQDIKVYSTIPTSEMSKSLASFVNKYNGPVDKMKSKLGKLGIDGSQYGTSGVLPPVGKLKHCEGKVLVEFYIKYHDKMSVGDKLVYFSALKGVVKEIFPEGKEPYSEYRPEEKVHSFLPVGSINARMVSSVLTLGSINKVLIELDRHVKDIMGVKWDPNP